MLLINPYRFKVAVEPKNPDEISGLQLWLDATTGLYDATTGGSPVTTHGSAVARWEDQSGNANHMLQGNINNRPILQTNQLNSLNGIYFDGSNDNFISANTVSLATSARTFFIVAKVLNTGARMIFGNGILNLQGKAFSITPEIYIRLAKGRQDFTTAYGTTDHRVLVVGMDSGAQAKDIYAYLDGNKLTASTANLFSVNTDTDYFRISTVGPGIYGFINAYYYEILAYNSSLSTTDRQAVEAYLTQKWGL